MQRLGDMIARKLRMIDARLGACEATAATPPEPPVEVTWEGYVLASTEVSALWTGFVPKGDLSAKGTWSGLVTQLDNSAKGVWSGFVTIV